MSFLTCSGQVPQYTANAFGAASDIGAAVILCIFFAGQFAELER